MGHEDLFVKNKKATQHLCEVKEQYSQPLVNGFYPFSIKTSFVNGLNIPITLVLRNGIKYTIPPLINCKHKEFIIEYEYEFQDNVIIDANNLLNDSSSESHKLKAITDNPEPTRVHGFKKNVFFYSFTKEDINLKGGNLYIYNLDMVVSLWSKNDSVSPHPFSETGLRNLFLEQTEEVNTYSSFGYSIRIIDNDNVFGTKYININNKVYQVNAVKDDIYRSGVYLISSGSVTGENICSIPVTNIYSFEDAEKELGLFNSYIEAQTLGNVLETKKKELDNYALEIKEKEAAIKKNRLEMDAEYEAKKRQLEFTRLEEEEKRKLKEINLKREESRIAEKQALLKEKLAEVEHERTLASLNRKDHYEEKSYARKDSSEAIKFVPLVLGGLIAIASIIYKHS